MVRGRLVHLHAPGAVCAFFYYSTPLILLLERDSEKSTTSFLLPPAAFGISTICSLSNINCYCNTPS